MLIKPTSSDITICSSLGNRRFLTSLIYYLPWWTDTSFLYIADASTLVISSVLLVL